VGLGAVERNDGYASRRGVFSVFLNIRICASVYGACISFRLAPLAALDVLEELGER